MYITCNMKSTGEGRASGLVDSGARADSITLLSFEVLGKVTMEKKRVSQTFRQKKIHYRKKERKKLALEKNQCPPFTDNLSYTYWWAIEP